MVEHILAWLLDASAWVLPVVIAITFHEVAHGWVAARFGDMTATNAGRVTLNPLKHVDRFGTLILPALLVLARSPVVLGYAKPVPVNFGALRPYRFGSVMVALAGPLTNLLLAIFCGLLLHLDQFINPDNAQWLFNNIARGLMINCVLMVFNMLPILPLDGGRVLAALLPLRARLAFARTERFGILIVFAALVLGPMVGLDIGRALLATPAGFAIEQILLLTGNADALALS